MHEQIKYQKDYDLYFLKLKNIIHSDEKIDKETLYQYFLPQSYAKGQYYTKEGEIEKKLGFVTQGLFKYYYIDANGNQKIHHFSYENTFVSAYSSLISQSPSHFFIEALEDSRVLQITHSNYQYFIDHYGIWSNIARRFTEEFSLEKGKKEASFLKDDALTRYKNFIHEYSFILPRLQQKDIASYLGITAVSLSRLRFKLKNQK